MISIKTPEEIQKYAKKIMEQQYTNIELRKSQADLELERINEAQTKGVTSNETKTGRDGRVNTRPKIQVLDDASASRESEHVFDTLKSDKNPYSGNLYVHDKIPKMNALDMFLCSFGIVTMSHSYEEETIKHIYNFITGGSQLFRIIFIITDSVGAYGLNIAKATKALCMPRAALHFSTQTIMQFCCRVGRQGLSNDAIVYLDTLTLVRLLEASIHTTDAALFPNLYIATTAFMSSSNITAWKEDADLKAKNAFSVAKTQFEYEFDRIKNKLSIDIQAKFNIATYRPILRAIDKENVTNINKLEELEENMYRVPDNILRNLFVAEFTRRLTLLGQSNRDCGLLDFIFGAIQHHLHEPCGIVDDNTVTSPLWPRGESDTDILITALYVVSKGFSQARDRSNYDVYTQFMAVRNIDRNTFAGTLTRNIAENVISKIKSSSMRDQQLRNSIE